MAHWPVFDEEQVQAVVSMLRTGQVNAWTGPYVRQFEEAYAAFIGVQHAIAVTNGTAALELALFALGLSPGDEVIVTPRSFVASAACVPFCGGVPVFADVDQDSQNITTATIAEKVSSRTKGIIVVHLAGWPCDMPDIMAFARENALWVIEDCAQAHGAEIDGRPVGSFGDIAAFSFCQDKIITTGGEGGLVAMNDPALWKRAWSRKDHGKSYDAVFREARGSGFRWVHESVGTNLRMMSYQAVLGLCQLARLQEWRAVRERNARLLIAATADLDSLRTPVPRDGISHAYYRFYTFVRPDRLKAGHDRDQILTALNAAGVSCFAGSCSEVYLEKAFASLQSMDRLPVARKLGETSLAFLVDPSVTEEVILQNARLLREAVLAATVTRKKSGRRQRSSPELRLGASAAGR
ncbi:DegT/DnrJ/EryC1/StrS family aminotransferase [Rhizobium gallicum]|uniref:DegT/DnrJ/EryC1/StrS family aminotransferase n=1 Tax=Rhizobium gallicum TaxID=56730 RepID=UPI001EF88979|nr:DegT/DnrJ/EryC1/StrS aminotransferase family protein [Rhizobium gallicum]ULJ75094.1 DegT/DnrJ/EryC1/StrS aminotransferase family protein [Rhizobium gallicum]